MRALFRNATLKRSPDESSTGALNQYVGDRVRALGVEVEHVRLSDRVIEPWVVSPRRRRVAGAARAPANVLVHTARAPAATPIQKPPNA